jgi:hypothetical protein
MSIKATVNFAIDMTADDLTDLTERMKKIQDIIRREESEPEIPYPKGEEVSFTAKIIAFDDTFRSDEADPIWGLAFTSRDITQIKNIGAVLGKTQKVRVRIGKVGEGSA